MQAKSPYREFDFLAARARSKDPAAGALSQVL